MNLYQILKDMSETAIYILWHSSLCHYSLSIKKIKNVSTFIAEENININVMMHLN